MPSAGWYILAIVLFPTILMCLDAYVEYKKGARQDQDKGISGFRRSIIALTVILIVGIAVFHLLQNPDDSSKELVSNVVSMLAGLVAAIAGFYFGGRAEQEKGGTTPGAGGKPEETVAELRQLKEELEQLIKERKQEEGSHGQ